MDLNRLLRPDKPHLHMFLTTEAEAWELLGNFARSAPTPVAARMIRGQKAESTAALFDELAAVFQFPPHFGANWDALSDCLTDLEWLLADAYILCVTSALRFLDKEPPEEFHKALHVLEHAGKEWGKKVTGQWARPARPFHVLFQGTKEDEAKLRARLQAAKAAFDVLE
jgi:RNAse (barnase) inhibitor barstar